MAEWVGKDHIFGWLGATNMDCPGVNLDLDNTSGGNNGPETITVFDYDPDQTYMIFVHDLL